MTSPKRAARTRTMRDGVPPRVQIEDMGRGGTVVYQEGAHRVDFWWEFALDPVLAYVDGPKRAQWAAQHPWAADDMEAIYEFVAAEVVRQRAESCGYEIDLDAGSIRILRVGGKRPRSRRQEVDLEALAMRAVPTFLSVADDEERPAPRVSSSAWDRFTRSVVAVATGEAERFDDEALAALTEGERREAVTLWLQRAEPGARELAAFAVLARLGSEEALASLRSGVSHHRSVAARLVAGEALHARGELADDALARLVREQLRALHDPKDGLAPALALAARFPSPLMHQALLYASCNATPCAPDCARALLAMRGALPAPPDAATGQLLADIGAHNSSFTRQAAFQTLCERTGLTYDPGAD